MTAIEINGKFGNFNLNLPTSKDEITSDWLKAVTSNIQIAPNYSLIALIYRDTFTNLINSTKKNNNSTVGVVPVFVKCGNTDSEFINDIETNDTIIISAGDISLGHHVTCKRNSISPKNILSLVSSDKTIYTKAMAHFENIYLVEFKLVPNVAINGVIEEYKDSFTDDFVTATPVGEA